MSTYLELQAKIAELQREAEEARLMEVERAIVQIHETMKKYGLTLADIQRPEKKPSKPRSTVPAKYQDPVSGATWTGRGRAPLWLNGRSKNDFIISE